MTDQDVPASDPHNVEAFAARLQGQGRLLGLDLGSKTIGLAISDSLWSIASPRETVKRTKFGKDAAYLLDLAQKESVTGLVLGWPINMNGTEGPRCQATAAFQRNLSKLTNLPMLYWDERMSTIAAERAMLEADLSRAKRSQRIDSVAASVILQAALDRLSNI